MLERPSAPAMAVELVGAGDVSVEDDFGGCEMV